MIYPQGKSLNTKTTDAQMENNIFNGKMQKQQIRFDNTKRSNLSGLLPLHDCIFIYCFKIGIIKRIPSKLRGRIHIIHICVFYFDSKINHIQNIPFMPALISDTKVP